MTRFTPLVAALPATVPFTGPEELERRRDRPFAARLGANENGFGPSPQAIAAMRDSLTGIWQYADPTSHELRHALAGHIGGTGANIVVDAGVDTLLGLLVRMTVAPGDRVVTSDGAYPTFNFHVAGHGGELIRVPYRDDHEDPDALIAAAEGARLVYLANPDNPMGSWLPRSRIEAMLDSLPDGALLVLDEAYAEFAPAEAVPQIAPGDPRVIRMRTFSKGYGMAGARVGYAIGHPDLIAGFERVRNHFGMNRTAQIGALAALRDQAWLDRIRLRVAGARDRIAAIAAANGLVALPSATNFVAVDCGRNGDFARRVLAELATRDIFVRMPGVAPLDRCIRVSVGPDDALALFEAALPGALQAARAG